jgi:recombination protein RecR
MLAASSARAGFVPLMNEIEHLIQFLAKLPGLGPRSARRAALFMLKRRDTVLEPLAKAMIAAKERVQTCSVCGNLDTISPCGICANPRRDDSLICVVEDVADLWALERGGTFHGRYHVLGGILSALDGVGPDDLNIASLLRRARAPEVREIILATNATVEGQTTAHYIADRLADCDVTISGLALGVPIGGELDYLDDGTLSTAMRARRRLG